MKKLAVSLFCLFFTLLLFAGKWDENLFKAITKGDVKAVEKAISKGADVNAKNKDGKTPLELAKEKGDRRICDLLASKEAKAGPTEKVPAGIELAVNKKTDKPVVELAAKTEKPGIELTQNVKPEKKLSPEQGSGPIQTEADSKVDLSKYPKREITEFLEAEKKGAVLEDLITKNLGPIPDPSSMSAADFKKHLQERLQEGKRIMENKAYIYLVTLQLVQTKEKDGVDYYFQNIAIPVPGVEWSISTSLAIGWDGKKACNDFFVSFVSRGNEISGTEIPLKPLADLYKQITNSKLMYAKITVIDQGNGVMISVVPLDKPNGETKVGVPTLSVFVDTINRQVYDFESMEIISMSVARK